MKCSPPRRSASSARRTTKAAEPHRQLNSIGSGADEHATIAAGIVVYPLGYLYNSDMELPDETISDLTKRLRRVEGQVRGITQMLADGRDCRDIVTQLSAANKALEQAGFVLVAAGLTWCLEDPERSAAEGYELKDVQKMFTKLA